MAIKRIQAPAEVAVGHGPAEVRRRIGRIDAGATATGACRAIAPPSGRAAGRRPQAGREGQEDRDRGRVTTANDVTSIAAEAATADEGTGTVWAKSGYLHGKRDPTTGEPRPVTIPPGMYCEDAGTLDRLKAHPKMVAMQRASMANAGLNAMPPFFGVADVRIVVASPEQAMWFRDKEAAGSAENH